MRATMSCFKTVLVVCTLGTLFQTTLQASTHDPDAVTDNRDNLLSDTKPDIFKQILSDDCRGIYSSHCMKIGVLKILTRIGGESFPIAGGLSLRADPVPSPLPATISELRDPARLDALLLHSLGRYLSSLSLNVNIMDEDTTQKLANAYYGNQSASGRKGGGGGGKYGGALAAAGLMSGGAMLAVAMSALAAVAGKALMASMMALMLAAIAALKGGGGEKTTTYEVISKPLVSHHHSHSSEVQHGHYKRSFDGGDILAYQNSQPDLKSS